MYFLVLKWAQVFLCSFEFYCVPIVGRPCSTADLPFALCSTRFG